MKGLSLIVFVLSFAITTPTTAADNNSQYGTQGDFSCGNWVKDRKIDNALSLAVDYNWLAGYITAYNRQTPDVFHILGSTDMESVYLWMDKYCQENPLSDTSNGMINLTEELWPNRKRTADD